MSTSRSSAARSRHHRPDRRRQDDAAAGLLGLLPRDGGEIRWNGAAGRRPGGLLRPAARRLHAAGAAPLQRDAARQHPARPARRPGAIWRGALRAAVLEADVAALERGLDTLVGPRGVRLSGGQVQRAAAARMFVREPELLVCRRPLERARRRDRARRCGSALLRPAASATCLVVSHRRPPCAGPTRSSAEGGGRRSTPSGGSTSCWPPARRCGDCSRRGRGRTHSKGSFLTRIRPSMTKAARENSYSTLSIPDLYRPSTDFEGLPHADNELAQRRARGPNQTCIGRLSWRLLPFLSRARLASDDDDDFDSVVVHAHVRSREQIVAALQTLVESNTIYRVKGFAALPGAPMRLVVQGVGRRFDSYFDRRWEASEAREPLRPDRRRPRSARAANGADGRARTGLAPCICCARRRAVSSTMRRASCASIRAPPIVVLSSADTTLSLLASVFPRLGAGFPSVRLANQSYLRQPASVDFYVEDVLRHARVVMVDHLGGEAYWPYGIERWSRSRSASSRPS